MDWIVSLTYTVYKYNAVYTIIDRSSNLVRFTPYKTDISAEDLVLLLIIRLGKYSMP